VTEGQSGIGPVSSFDASTCQSRVAGEIRRFVPEDFLARREVQAFSRYLHLGVAAARMAWEDAALPVSSVSADRVGVFVGSAVGPGGRIVSDAGTFYAKGLERVHPMLPAQYAGCLPSEISIALGTTGPTYAICSACTAGADAAGLAMSQIAGGVLDIAIVGGSDAPIFPLLFAAFDRLQVLSRHNEPPAEASRPFSADRNGFVLSEGSGMLILEAEDVALNRGARVYAEFSGFGATSDAFHHLQPASDGVQAARAIALALANAGLAADDVDHLNAHGTGTLKNDAAETIALKRVFGKRAYRIPITASKSMLGHQLGASAAVELILCALTIRNGVVPPTINLVNPDPLCDLDYVSGGARRVAVRTVVSTSFGFGARNAAVVLRSYD
jgi:3-oxoacyl-[acyl-carrier-protein] synthase II